MSENLDLVRSIYADWERGDFSRADWADPEIAFVRADGPDAGTWTGLAGMAEGMRYRLSAWEDWRIAAAEFRDLDEERVLVLSHATARGKRSGLEVRQMNAAVFHIRADKVTRLITYTDHVDALANLGLEGQAVSQENVEVVRRFVDAFNRRDAAAVAALLHPEVEWHVRAGPSIGLETLRGRDAALSFMFEEIHGAWSDFRSIAEGVSELRGGHVLAVGRYEGRGTVSGVETRMHYAAIFRLDAGMIVFFQDFATRREALKAVGLEE